MRLTRVLCDMVRLLVFILTGAGVKGGNKATHLSGPEPGKMATSSSDIGKIS